MHRIIHKLRITASCLITTGVLASSLTTQAASLREITGFGTNPSNLRMHLYVPDAVPNNAPILVANHYCTGTGPALYSGTQFASLADRYGFIVIYPSATRSGQCFDVSTTQALTRGGGSDPVGIMSMVNYVKQNYNVDSTRIFATGVSSGAMMTNVLLGLYPDVFKAGAAFAGVPFGCFATSDGSTWNSACANGTVNKTPQEWGNLMRAAYPGYNGVRPRMQLWHGTADDTLRYPNFNEAIELWTNIHGLGQTPIYTDSPQSGATRTRYGSAGDQAQVEAISLQGTGHNLPVNAAEAIRFFGLNAAVTSSASSVRSSTPASSAPGSSSPGSVAASSTANTGDRCNWYGIQYPLCLNSQNGWGYESNRSCIGRNTCIAQPTPFGVVGGNVSSAASSLRSSTPASSIPASSAPSNARSSISTGQACNWWGTRYPLCITTQSGWGWENQRSCISRSTCTTQPAPYGVVN
jgi:poly(hydroxyalkanoate) depolymerase family esterase